MKDDEGKTPLDIAYSGENKGIAKYLEEHIEKIKIANKTSNIPKERDPFERGLEVD